VKKMLDNGVSRDCFLIAFEVGLAGDVPRLPQRVAARSSLVFKRLWRWGVTGVRPVTGGCFQVGVRVSG
jgi:hypothetical protein